jgi:hypothetical protein
MVTNPSTQTGPTARTGEHAGGRHLVPTGRAVEPVAAILALRVGKTLFFLALGTHTVHLAVRNVICKDQPAFCTDLGIATMIGSLAARCRADENRMTGVTPVLATGHFLTHRTLFHQTTSTDSSTARKREHLLSTGTAPFAIKLITSRKNFHPSCSAADRKGQPNRAERERAGPSGPGSRRSLRDEAQPTLKNATGPA